MTGQEAPREIQDESDTVSSSRPENTSEKESNFIDELSASAEERVQEEMRFQENTSTDTVSTDEVDVSLTPVESAARLLQTDSSDTASVTDFSYQERTDKVDVVRFEVEYEGDTYEYEFDSPATLAGTRLDALLRSRGITDGRIANLRSVKVTRGIDNELLLVIPPVKEYVDLSVDVSGRTLIDRRVQRVGSFVDRLNMHITRLRRNYSPFSSIHRIEYTESDRVEYELQFEDRTIFVPILLFLFAGGAKVASQTELSFVLVMWLMIGVLMGLKSVTAGDSYQYKEAEGSTPATGR